MLLCSDGLHGLVGDPALAVLMAEPHTVAESVMLLVTAARAAGGSDNITAIVLDVGGDRLAPPKDDDDLPTFREFDPQKEGDPALTVDVVRRAPARRADRLADAVDPADRSRSPASTRSCVSRSESACRPPHCRSRTSRGRRVATSPAAGRQTLVVVVAIAIVACAIAWVLGGR